jgi:MarR family transcriptional regulator, lower aerobic nicotinate degradation pathway regulator
MPSPAPAGPPPTRLANRATWLVSRLYARASGLLNAGFEAHHSGLRGYHYRLLAALEEWGPTSQADLGRSTGLDRSDVTNALNDLQSRGLVTRSVDPTHRRRNIVTINQNGTAILAELDKVVDDVQEQFLAPLTAAQQRQLLSLMSRLLAERS